MLKKIYSDMETKKIGKGNIDFNKGFENQALKNADLINQRRMINGKDDGLMQVSPLKHPLSMEIFQKMLANTWMPQEIPMNVDVEQWRGNVLTQQEKEAYEKCLAFVSNLDGILNDSIANDMARHVTSPEARLTITRHAFEEAVHVLSYSFMIEALGLDPEYIYGMYRKEKSLWNKNTHILQSLSDISDKNFETGNFKNDQIFLEACISNVISEGIYFYSAFLFFYVLKRNNKMPGSAAMIQFINRDEEMHVKHFTYMANVIRQEQPELWTAEFQEKITQKFIDGVNMEIEWGKYYLNNGIQDLSIAALTQYIQYIGNRRMSAFELPKIWHSAKNPFNWLDEMYSANIETNFFEGRVREYATGTLDWE